MPPPGSVTLLASLWLRLSDAVKEAFAAQIEFRASQRRGRTERVVEMVYSQRGVFAVVAQDDGGSIMPGDIDEASPADRRRKDEIGNAIKSERLAVRFARRGFEPGQDVLIVSEEKERVAVEHGPTAFAVGVKRVHPAEVLRPYRFALHVEAIQTARTEEDVKVLTVGHG